MSGRNAFYEKLYNMDISEGVKHEETAVHSVDKNK
jgi:hypothetical protein